MLLRMDCIVIDGRMEIDLLIGHVFLWAKDNIRIITLFDAGGSLFEAEELHGEGLGRRKDRCCGLDWIVD